MEKHTIFVPNIHCDGCATSISRILELVDPRILLNAISLKDRKIILESPVDISIGALAYALHNGGYEVESIDDHDMATHEGWANLFLSRWKRKNAHRASCPQCQEERTSHSFGLSNMKSRKSAVSSSSDATLSGVTMDRQETTEYRAVFSIGNMSCGACAESIRTSVKEDMPEILNIGIDLVGKSGTFIIPDKSLTPKIQRLIKDLGYTCELVEVLPSISTTSYKVIASIGGMTCGACANTIQDQTETLDYVKEVKVNLIANSAEFIVSDSSKAPLLKEAVEDLGYHFEQVSIEEVRSSNLKKNSRSVNLKVVGMFCEHCPDNINEVLHAYGDALVIDDPIALDNPYIKFTYIPDFPTVTIRSILDKIKDVSPQFEVEIVHPMSLEERSALLARQEQRRLLLRLIFTFIVAIPTFVVGIIGTSLAPSTSHIRIFFEKPVWVGSVSRAVWALFIMATPVFFFAADAFHVKSYHEIRGLWKKGVPWTRRLFKFGSMNLLMSLGTSIAYFASIVLLVLSSEVSPDDNKGYTTTYFDSVVFLTLFLLLGRFLDIYSKASTASAITLLMSLKEDTVQLIDQIETLPGKRIFGPSRPISVELVEIGDYVRILPGQSCSADGIIVEGESEFNESALTGESVPVQRGFGEEVFAGTVNSGSSPVVTKLTSVKGEFVIDTIIDIVRQGQLHRAPIERFAQKMVGLFVPIVTALSVVTWLIWLALGLSGTLPDRYLDIQIGSWPVWSLQFSIAVFVIACPCGIALAAPTALFVGSGLAAKYGILARGGGEAFQESSKVDIVCFDKTGTLTEGGEPKITSQWVQSDGDQKFFLQAIRELELNSNHPLSIAVCRFVDSQNIENSVGLVSNTQELAGKGLRGTLQSGVQCIVGNERLMAENDAVIPQEVRREIDVWKSRGESVILFAIATGDGLFNVVLALSAADKIRPESEPVIKALTAKGIECWMISGDNEITAKAVARRVGISPENVISEVLPQEKSEKISWLQKTGKSHKGNSRAIVAMVGDGINDAPSLTVADVGIAIGSGSDIALSSASFVLLKSNLYSLLTLFDISKVVFRRIKFNFMWAVVYNVIGIPIAAGVIYPYRNSRLDPVWASLAMALSSLSVITSSLLLKLYKPRHGNKIR
jgi:P-type Cu+ transporter